MEIEFGGWTLGVVVVVGLATLVLGWIRPYAALSFLILGVPFRDFATRWLNVHTGLTIEQVTAIGRWWFVLIFALLALTGGRWLFGIVRTRAWPKLEAADWLLALVLVVAAVATLTASNRSAAFTSLRGYLQPLGVYLLARLIRPGRQSLRWLLYLWLAVGMIMALFGLWQAIGWEEADYRAEGYVRQNGDLVTPPTTVRGQRYIRPASVVSGPNELGVDMLLLFLLAAFQLPGKSRTARLLSVSLALLFTAGLAATLSRSALLGFLAALLAFLWLHANRLRGWLSAATPRVRMRLLWTGLTGLVVAGLVLGSFGFFSLLGRTLSRLPREYHIRDSLDAIQFLAQNPGGTGMGLVQPKGAFELLETEGAYHVEGSIFQIAVEMGVWGLTAWLAFWGAALARIWRNWRSVESAELRVLTGTAFAGWLGSLVAFLFLPLMQSISLMVWLWFLLGAGYQARSTEAGWIQRPAAAGAV